MEEVERLLRFYHLDEALRLVAPGSRASELPRRYANLLVEMDPDLEPVYNGIRLTPPGLETAASEAISSGGDCAAGKVCCGQKDQQDQYVTVTCQTSCDGSRVLL